MSWRNVLFIMFFTGVSARCLALEAPGPAVHSNEILLKKLLAVPVKEMEKLGGRKLSLKEKIGLKLLRWKYRKSYSYGTGTADPKAERRAQTALTFGLATVAFVLIGLVLPVMGWLAIPCAVIALLTGLQSLGKTKNNAKSVIGILLGTLFILLFFIALSTF